MVAVVAEVVPRQNQTIASDSRWRRQRSPYWLGLLRSLPGKVPAAVVGGIGVVLVPFAVKIAADVAGPALAAVGSPGGRNRWQSAMVQPP